MINRDQFSSEVVEIFDMIENGPILNSSYTGREGKENIIYDIRKALEVYKNQDVDPPNYFLQDIIDDASGDIPTGESDIAKKNAKYSLIEYEEKVNFFEAVLKNIKPLKKSLKINNKDLGLMADLISGQLYLCAKSRFLLQTPHPFFERLLYIIKNQGFPYAWCGNNSWKDGEFLIFSRPA